MKQNKLFVYAAAAVVVVLLGGCGQGYQNGWLYPEDVKTVYVEMFDTTGFRRGYEYELTDAICKLIESRTPYKIVSDRNVADSVLSGNLGIGVGVLAGDPYTGRALENETVVNVNVTWKNLKTGELLVDNEVVYASSTYSTQLGQTINYSIRRSVNEVAQKVVEQMQISW
ncbi:MAG: hypothetical protein ISS71_00315 [Phycisphaerae bacterium]|nr:hypothetical protein [Phycisphaerae bacterium]